METYRQSLEYKAHVMLGSYRGYHIPTVVTLLAPLIAAHGGSFSLIESDVLAALKAHDLIIQLIDKKVKNDA